MMPPLVSHALRLATVAGFDQSCSHQVGRLLQLLASHPRTGTIGEIGTGFGVGAAWMASALQPGVVLFTVESDEKLAAAATRLFRSVPTVRVLAGDWREILSHGPFDMLFVDARAPKEDHPDDLIGAVRPGGMIVLDDFTPIEAQPREWRDRADPLRDFWLHDPRLHSVEIQIAPGMAVILATRTAER